MPYLEVTNLPGKEIIPGYFGRSLHTGQMTLMFWTVQKGASMPLHSHFHEQVAQVISGKFEMNLDGVIKILKPGDVALIPPHAVHGGKAITACELMDIFRPEREDYKFS